MFNSYVSLLVVAPTPWKGGIATELLTRVKFSHLCFLQETFCFDNACLKLPGEHRTPLPTPRNQKIPLTKTFFGHTNALTKLPQVYDRGT